jgi:bifunctional enzyme CysN/CysC
MSAARTHLQRLEAESIHIMREVVAECEHPVMLYSIGKDSAVMLHLAMKAFSPATPPLPLLHVDTTWKFREMYQFRDAMAKKLGMSLLVHVNEEGLAQGIGPFSHGSQVHTDVMKTQALKQALDKHRFDAAFSGARRDEEKSRAKERIFSVRSAQHRWEPKAQRPELWHLYNTRKRKGESLRVFPLSNWTELDVWQYIYLEAIPIVPLYFAAERSVVEREGALIMVDDERMPLRPGEQPMTKRVRFRTLGCYPLTGAVESNATTLPQIIQEMLLTTTSERQGRVIDHDQAAIDGTEEARRLPLMAHVSELIERDIVAYLDAHQHKSLLRFITCGSVDDGKSSLIGRLLYESMKDSKKVGTRGGEIDFALLVGGLAAEREQGITIDVAYRFFSTDRRNFIVADTPGHEQYTRNMVTGASTADLAVILVDARKGLLTQTRRHSYLVHLLGIRRVVLAVNKMDLVNYARETFEQIERDYRTFAERLGSLEIVAIPLSAVHGDNIVATSHRMPWYSGTTLMAHLETVPLADGATPRPFRLPVQWVNRPNLDFRGYAGLLASGTIRAGDAMRVLPSGQTSRVRSILSADRKVEAAVAGDSVTITLADEIDVSRGDVIVPFDTPLEVADQFEATVVWMHEDPLLPGRSYLMKIGGRTVNATVARLKHEVNVNTLAQTAARTLELNGIGVCEIGVDRPIPFAPYAESRDLGGFIFIDRISNATVGAGMLHFALRRSQNVHWQALDVNKQARARMKAQNACVVWFTGLSGSGKSAIANTVEKQLHALGRHTYLLDGDNVRHGLSKNLGFTDADRVENIRRVAEVCRLMVDAGLIVLVSFISPFRAERRLARSLVEADEFLEIFVDTPLEVAEARDPKGLYRKARAGQLKNFTGVDSPYERPEHPELHIDTTQTSIEAGARLVLDALRARGLLRDA